MHVGVSEMYLKPGSKITFTMVHNWAEQVEVRPRTGVKLGDDSTYINNYILTSPVSTLQSYPTAYCDGKNSRAIFQSIQGGKKDSIIDVGSRVLLNAEGARGEVISRAVAQDESKIYARGHLAGTVPTVKGHLECHGLVLSDDSFIYAVPELEASSANLEMSHEAAVGKISEDFHQSIVICLFRKRKQSFFVWKLLEYALNDIGVKSFNFSFDNGRWFLTNNEVYFSLSHSFDMVAVAISSQFIGVDIEIVSDKLLKLQKRYLNGDSDEVCIKYLAECFTRKKHVLRLKKQWIIKLFL
jgi:hypothetical protein